jgi:hypothetical protein
MRSTKEQWSKILGYCVGQKVKMVSDCWYCGRTLRGRKGIIKKIGYDTSHTIIIYYIKLNWIRGLFQLIKGEFEAI